MNQPTNHQPTPWASRLQHRQVLAPVPQAPARWAVHLVVWQNWRSSGSMSPKFVRFHGDFFTTKQIPSREWIHIPPWEKENHLQNAIFGGYVSSLEGTHQDFCWVYVYHAVFWSPSENMISFLRYSPKKFFCFGGRRNNPRKLILFS